MSKLDERSCGLREHHILLCCISSSPLAPKPTVAPTAENEHEMTSMQYLGQFESFMMSHGRFGIQLHTSVKKLKQNV